jgi:hypothetical protein
MENNEIKKKIKVIKNWGERTESTWVNLTDPPLMI